MMPALAASVAPMATTTFNTNLTASMAPAGQTSYNNWDLQDIAKHNTKTALLLQRHKVLKYAIVCLIHISLAASDDQVVFGGTFSVPLEIFKVFNHIANKIDVFEYVSDNMNITDVNEGEN